MTWLLCWVCTVIFWPMAKAVTIKTINKNKQITPETDPNLSSILKISLLLRFRKFRGGGSPLDFFFFWFYVLSG